ncbi:ABC transporter substrate-binding protein [Nonomuraea jiangxiensis]|uniref:Peptide/nickel transport system substrate-binding protein n=1 Tax=Nonomuraea jiangxiensis TaxID=633440 RepID=A0A1G9MN47_9ACTN|nr:ABC transporter substrate-binding protein [Nonomuraea jiangxiensis]SDL75337.1 peptide/nickel transport system substrate-binding protein [Nonomuraea jiangxiensis]
MKRLIPALLLALTACGAPAAQDARATTLTWAIETQPITLNPQLWSQNKVRLLVFNQFDALISRGEDGSFQPWLARSWQVSDDGLTYTLDLRDDVTFHDGTRFDAAAVKANLDQFRTPGYNPAVASIQLRAFKEAKVLSPTTLEITLKEPDALFLDFLASPYAGQVSPKSLKNAKDLEFGGLDLVGTGPFILDRYVQGQEIHYRRNPAYKWPPAGAAHQGPAHLSEITYRFLPEAAVRVGALTSGQVQVIEGVPATEVGLIKKDPNLALHTALNSGTAYSYYFNTSHAPFDDRRVREAFREAVDVDAVLRSVYQDTATRAWSIVGKRSPFYDATLERTYGGDVARANALLDAAGWRERDAEGFRVKAGKRLTVREVASAPFVRDRRDILSQAIQAQVKQNAGIDLQVRIVDQGSAQQALDQDQYEIFGNSRGDSDAGAALNLILPDKASINRTNFTDPRVDEWLAAASAVSDPAERAKLYAKVQRAAVVDNAIVFPLYVPADQIAAAKSVQGLGFDPASGTPAGAYDVRIGT